MKDLFVKGEKELYQPPATPGVVRVPEMRFLMVDGHGNPNDAEGMFAQATQTLYTLSYTIKMSKMSGQQPDGYFEYSVAPLEGLWEMHGGEPGIDYQHKENFCWTIMIRQPDFVTADVFVWACAEATRKKKPFLPSVRLEAYAEGLCVQCMHTGAYDDEPVTVAKLEAFWEANGLLGDYEHRRHHEIYLKDPRRTEPAKMKTILRIPVRPKEDA